MKRFLTLALTAAMSLILFGCGSGEPVTAELYAMDTMMALTAYGSGADQAVAEAKTLLTELEKQLSRTREDSEVSRLNRAGGAAVEVGEHTAYLLQRAAEYSAAVNGAFDITIAPVVSAWGFTTDAWQVPSQSELDSLLAHVDYTGVTVNGSLASLEAEQAIDLGGIAKGYASAKIAALFVENGVEHGKVELGGNVYVRGAKPDGSLWRIGVQDPNDPAGYTGILSLADAFAVTSGGYQRYFQQDGRTYHHIIDPATGYPADSGLISVTVVADAAAAPDSGTMCDAFSTALFVMGEEAAIDFWRSGGYDFELVMVTNDDRVLVTAGLEDAFEPMEGTDYTYEIIH